MSRRGSDGLNSSSRELVLVTLVPWYGILIDINISIHDDSTTASQSGMRGRCNAPGLRERASPPSTDSPDSGSLVRHGLIWFSG